MTMQSLLASLFCFAAACSTSRDGTLGSSSDDAPPDQPLAEVVYKPAQLDGAGQCLDPVCSLHFAVEATGDVETFSSARCAEPGCGSWHGKLTPKAQATLRELAGRLIKERFEPAYGCGRCTDGPEHEVIIHHPDGRVLSHTLDPRRPDKMPPLLREASTLIQTLSDTLDRCEASELLVPAPGCKEIAEIELKRPSGFP